MAEQPEDPEKEVVRWLQAQTGSAEMPPELLEKLLQLPPLLPSILQRLPPPPPNDWVSPPEIDQLFSMGSLTQADPNVPTDVECEEPDLEKNFIQASQALDRQEANPVVTIDDPVVTTDDPEMEDIFIQASQALDNQEANPISIALTLQT